MLTLGVIGDYGVNSDSSVKVAKMVKSWNPKAILTTGDNIYTSPNQKNYSSIVGALYKEYLGSGGNRKIFKKKKLITLRNKEHQDIGTNTKFLPCVGNHDFEGSFSAYTNYFGLDTYYGAEFVQHKNLVKLISLNNYVDTDRNFECKSSIQRTWLEKELSLSSEVKWVIVYFHYPQRCSNSNQGENEVKRRFPFENYPNVALVLSGHQHVYERLEVRGIPNVVVGTSGHSVRVKYPNPLPESKCLDDSGFGALKLEIDSNQIVGSYFVVGPMENNNMNTNVLKDSFVISSKLKV